VWCDNSQELLAASLRPGNAGSNTTADHIEVLTRAIAQVPAGHRRKLLVRADGTGASHGLLDWLTTLNTAGEHGRRGRSVEYSVGFALTDTVRGAISLVPKTAWAPAVAADVQVREHADVVEITDLLTLTGWPSGIRVIVRREHPHPGAPLSLFEHRDGWRYQAFVTNTTTGQVGFLEARHRAHAVLKQGRGPDPGRQGHRPVPVSVPRVRRQPSVVDRRSNRRRPARLDAADRAARGVEGLRTQGAALPVPARPGHPHQRRPPTSPATARDMALGQRGGGYLHEPDGHPDALLTAGNEP
jgi:Transposase DDE domain group 1